MDNLPFRPPLRGFAAGQTVFVSHTLVRLLGRGGLCEVWLARDEVSGRDVALKFVPEAISGIDDICRAACCAGALSHPRIVRVYDFLREGGMEAVSMEYVAGETLASWRSERAAQVFQPAELTKWVGQHCWAGSRRPGRVFFVGRAEAVAVAPLVEPSARALRILHESLR
jgi:hypothetical protein